LKASFSVLSPPSRKLLNVGRFISPVDADTSYASSPSASCIAILRRRPSSLRWHTGIAVLATGESGCASDKRSCLPSNEFSFTTTLGSVSRNAERPRDRIPERPHRKSGLAVNPSNRSVHLVRAAREFWLLVFDECIEFGH
jgi:hypothetical protein